MNARFWAVILCAAVGLVLISTVLDSFLVVSRPLQQADAIVLMAGSRKVREPAAARLYAEGRAPSLLLANDGVRADFSPDHGRNLFQAEWAKVDLMDGGVPESAIVILPYTASGTIHDARHAHGYVRNHSEIRRLLVVTSDYHTRRTLWTFQRVFEGEGGQIGVVAVPDHAETWWHRICVLYLEFIKYVYYRIAY